MTYHVQFPGLGIDTTVNTDAFHIGDFTIKWYGVIIAVGFLLAFLYALSSCKKMNINQDRLLDVVIVGILVGVVGARLYYVAFYPGDMYIKRSEKHSVYLEWRTCDLRRNYRRIARRRGDGENPQAENFRSAGCRVSRIFDRSGNWTLGKFCRIRKPSAPKQRFPGECTVKIQKQLLEVRRTPAFSMSPFGACWAFCCCTSLPANCAAMTDRRFCSI